MSFLRSVVFFASVVNLLKYIIVLIAKMQVEDIVVAAIMIIIKIEFRERKINVITGMLRKESHLIVRLKPFLNFIGTGAAQLVAS